MTASYNLDYTLLNSLYDDPSWGPKHGLSLVDSHSFPLTWDNAYYGTGAKMRIGQRLQTSNAAFTLQPTTPFTLHRAVGGVVVETKDFMPQPAVSQFHDSLGYFPGFYYNGDGFLYWHDRAASTVIPALGNYTTQIADLDDNLIYDLFGIDVGGTILGTGNPGDDGVQFGLHLAVSEKAQDGSWGMVKMWNSQALIDVEKLISHAEVRPGQVIKYTIKVKNLTPVNQLITMHDVLPAGITFRGMRPFYDPATNSIEYTIWLRPNSTRVLTFMVQVNHDVPIGTVITNEVHVTDQALGGSASVSTTVVK